MNSKYFSVSSQSSVLHSDDIMSSHEPTPFTSVNTSLVSTKNISLNQSDDSENSEKIDSIAEEANVSEVDTVTEGDNDSEMYSSSSEEDFDFNIDASLNITSDMARKSRVGGNRKTIVRSRRTKMNAKSIGKSLRRSEIKKSDARKSEVRKERKSEIMEPVRVERKSLRIQRRSEVKAAEEPVKRNR